MVRIHAALVCLLLAPSLMTAFGQSPAPEAQPPAPLEGPPPRVLPSPGAGPPPNACPVPTGLADDGGSGSTFAELKDNFLKLKAEREALQAERLAAAPREPYASATAEDNIRLRLRLTEILTRLGTKTSPPTLVPPPSLLPPAHTNGPGPQQKTEKPGGEQTPFNPSIKEGVAPPPELIRPLDPLALAQALFRANKYEASLKAYRLIDQRGMRAEERLPIQYMIATCLKRLGKTEEATTLYREIANSRGDESVAGCAQGQLSTLRWQQEMQAQLTSIRQRRAALEKRQ
jgi:hypothetical protein